MNPLELSQTISSEGLHRVVYAKMIIQHTTSTPRELFVLSQVCSGWRDTVFNFMDETWNQKRTSSSAGADSQPNTSRRDLVVFLLVGQYGLAQQILHGGVSKYSEWRVKSWVCVWANQAFRQTYLLRFFGSKEEGEISNRLLTEDGKEKYSETDILTEIVKGYGLNDNFFRSLLDVLKYQVQNTEVQPELMRSFLSHILVEKDMELLKWFAKNCREYVTLTVVSAQNRKRELPLAIYFLQQAGLSYGEFAKEWASLGYNSEDHATSEFTRMMRILLSPFQEKPEPMKPRPIFFT